jgi:hypothetical protein
MIEIQNKWRALNGKFALKMGVRWESETYYVISRSSMCISCISWPLAAGASGSLGARIEQIYMPGCEL